MDIRHHHLKHHAWDLHRTGFTDEAVVLLDAAITGVDDSDVVVLLANARAQILMNAERHHEAARGLLKVLGLTTADDGLLMPSLPSRQLMEALLDAQLLTPDDGDDLVEPLLEWLVTDSQDQGEFRDALYYAGMLTAMTSCSAPEDALAMARRWAQEAERLGDEGQLKGLRHIAQKLDGLSDGSM